jgi:uncharacterized protein (DUF302 family)
MTMLFKHKAATEEAKAPKRARMDFARSVRLEGMDAEVALAQAKSAFALEGFGVLAVTDLRGTLEAKLDKTMGPLWVVDFCNPSLAERALAVDHKMALLMPCRVALWQDGRDTVVAALRPVVASALMGLDELQPFTREAERHLERALLRLEFPDREPRALSDDDELAISEGV